MQHSKCCVVSQPPWVQIPALPPPPPGPNGAGRFCYAWMVWARARVCLWPLGCFWRCLCVWAGLLGVPVGGGPPASRPCRELRSARRLEARPGPAATHGHLSLAPLSSSNFARNSPVAYSNIEFVSLELQRFWAVSKSDRGELCAKFVWRWPCERVLAQPTGRSLHRGRVLWILRCLPLHTCGAWSVVVLASSISASRSVQNSPCSVFC